MPQDSQCFLCSPDEDLVVGRSRGLFVMVGLGPLTDRYLMIATESHVQSFADMYLADPSIADQIEEVRDKLQQGAAHLLMTEHGRVPACVDKGSEHDAHCFHAHFLLFQSTQSIEAAASTYFMRSATFERLSEALEYAAQSENYHLMSPCSQKYIVYTGALNVRRQFFRQLVAIQEDQSELADWRDRPNQERALADAERERIRYGASG